MPFEQSFVIQLVSVNMLGSIALMNISSTKQSLLIFTPPSQITFIRYPDNLKAYNSVLKKCARTTSGVLHTTTMQF